MAYVQPIDILNYLEKSPILYKNFKYLLDTTKLKHTLWGIYMNTKPIESVINSPKSFVEKTLKWIKLPLRTGYVERDIVYYMINMLANIQLVDKLLDKLAGQDLSGFQIDILGPKYQTSWASMSEGHLQCSISLWNKENTHCCVKCLFVFKSFEEFQADFRLSSVSNTQIDFKLKAMCVPGPLSDKYNNKTKTVRITWVEAFDAIKYAVEIVSR